jgi:hypothetical protein
VSKSETNNIEETRTKRQVERYKFYSIITKKDHLVKNVTQIAFISLGPLKMLTRKCVNSVYLPVWRTSPNPPNTNTEEP